MTTKPQSVRTQRTFQDHMATLHQQIDNLVYAGELVCESIDDFNACTNIPCPFHGEFGCKCLDIRSIIGDHTPQHDIEISPDDTQSKKKESRCQ